MDILTRIKDSTRVFFGIKEARRTSVDFLQSMKDFSPASLQKNISIKEYIQSDADLAANLRRLIDNILLNNPILVPKDGKNVSKKKLIEYTDKLETIRFYKLLRTAIYSLVWSGNAFIEIERTTGGELKNLYFMDPEYMKFRRNKNGGIIGFRQEVPEKTPVNFSKDEVIHMTIDHLDSGASGASFIGALRQALIRKDIAESYLSWIISNNKLNKFWTVTGDLNEEDVTATLQALRYNSKNPDLTTVIHINDGIEIDFRRYFDTADFESIMKYIDEQKTAILSILQVPPIIGGNIDASNRSNSEVQARVVFYNTIRNFQRNIVDELNHELLSQLEWKNVMFKFPNSDRTVTAEIFKLATAMQGLGFTQEAILEFLKSEGFEIPKVETLFEEKNESLGMDANGRNPMAPTASREPRSKAGIPQKEKERISDRESGVRTNVN